MDVSTELEGNNNNVSAVLANLSAEMSMLEAFIRSMIEEWRWEFAYHVKYRV